MEPISGIDVNSSRGTAGSEGLRGMAEAAPAGTSRASSTQISSNSLAILSVQNAVTQLLQSVGGGVENDKVLRTLLVALILLSLLAEQQNSEGATSPLLSQLGNRTSDQSQYIGIFTSSTTISIEQSTTTVVFTGSNVDASQTTGGEPQADSGRIDTVA